MSFTQRPSGIRRYPKVDLELYAIFLFLSSRVKFGQEKKWKKSDRTSKNRRFWESDRAKKQRDYNASTPYTSI